MSATGLLSLSEIKEREIQILQYIHDLCEHLGLIYFMGYGTLIGAVRHHGFIPWDDDIDICMPRKDYDILISYLYNQEKENIDFAILVHEYNKDYYYEFAKVVDKHSIVEEIGVDPIQGMGVWIDVFPLDFIPENRLLRAIQRVCIAESFFLRVLSVYPSFPQKYPYLVWPIWKYARRVGHTRYLNRIKKISLWTKTSRLIGFVPSFNIKHDYCDAEMLLNRKLLKFEDREFYAPVGYDEYLRTIYGDYMTLPPEEKRVHHSFLAMRK